MSELTGFILTICVVYVFLSLMLALKGKEKGLGFMNTILISLLLTPLAGMIFVMMSKRKYPKRVRDKNFTLD